RLGRLKRQPTIGGQDDAGDERGIVRGQEQRAAGALFRAAVAPKRVAIARELVFERVLSQAGGLALTDDLAGGDRVTADAVAPIVERDAARQRIQPGLGDAID